MRIIDYVQQGGPIMYVLLAFNIIGFTILIWKFLSLQSFKSNLQNTAQKIKDQNLASTDAIKDEVSHELQILEKGLPTVKIIASVAPLLGLLGTVVGILSAFQVIAKSGLEDPSLFAGGISMALVTTVAGLIVAIPHFIGYNYIASALDVLETKLERMILSKSGSNNA